MKRIRTQVLKLSQMRLAEIAEVDQTTVSRWDRGQREPSRVEMARIRDYARTAGLKWSDKWFFEIAA